MRAGIEADIVLKGRIDERSIRAPAPPAAPPAPIDPDRAVSPPAAGHQAVRPAALADLAKAPVVSASADAASSLSRRTALPTGPADPGVVLDKALKHINVWRGLLVAGEEPQARPWSPEKALDYAAPIMTSALAGLDALAALKMQGGALDCDADQTEGTLLYVLLTASHTVLDVRDDMIKQQWDQLRAMSAETAETAETALGPAEDCVADFKQLQSWGRELVPVRDALDEIVRRFKSSGTSEATRALLRPIMPAVTGDQSICRTAMQMVHGIVILDSSAWLLMLAEHKGLPDVAERVRELQLASHHRREEVAAASSALEAEAAESWMRKQDAPRPMDPLTRQALFDHHEVLQEYGARLDQVGLNLCLDAAAMIEMHDADGLWQCMMDIAHAISGYREGLQALCRAAGRVQPAPAGRPLPQAAEPPLPAVAAEPSGGLRRKPEKAGKPSKRPGAASAAVPSLRPAPVDTRTDAQKQADTLLKRYAVDRKIVSQFDGDLVRIAQSLGKDTRTLERELTDPKNDAAKSADYLRSVVKDWLGDAERIDFLNRALKALPSGDTARVGQLTSRIKALERIVRQVDAMEADLLKSDACPRAPHLDRLLTAKDSQIRSVSQPVRLPAATRNDRYGTLFEMRIELKRLSDGQRVEPWVVHIHTHEPTTAEALCTKPPEAFVAVHLKTFWEKNLGRKWEEVMRALGYADARVHRGPIGATLLGELFARVKPSGDQRVSSSG